MQANNIFSIGVAKTGVTIDSYTSSGCVNLIDLTATFRYQDNAP